MQTAPRPLATLELAVAERPRFSAPRVRGKRKGHTPAAIMGRSKLFLDFQRAFSAASGLTVLLGQPDGRTGIEWPAESANPFCARLAAAVNACEICREFQASLAKAATARGSTQTRRCHAGLAETMVPVRYGNRIFALLQIGQVRLRAATDDEVTQAAHNIAAVSPSLDMNILARELKTSRALDPARHAGLVQLLEIFSHQLAEWFVRLGAAEAPRPISAATKTVMRIKEWLHANYHKPITLGGAAKAMELSPWYFSKVVHSGTGKMFRALIVEVRLERARHLLAHENIKITDVAAAVGFQSISQFNRTFKKATGQTATEYRRASAAGVANRREIPRPSSARQPTPMNSHEPAVARVA